MVRTSLSRMVGPSEMFSGVGAEAGDGREVYHRSRISTNASSPILFTQASGITTKSPFLRCQRTCESSPAHWMLRCCCLPLGAT